MEPSATYENNIVTAFFDQIKRYSQKEEGSYEYFVLKTDRNHEGIDRLVRERIAELGEKEKRFLTHYPDNVDTTHRRVDSILVPVVQVKHSNGILKKPQIVRQSLEDTTELRKNLLTSRDEIENGNSESVCLHQIFPSISVKITDGKMFAFKRGLNIIWRANQVAREVFTGIPVLIKWEWCQARIIRTATLDSDEIKHYRNQGYSLIKRPALGAFCQF